MLYRVVTTAYLYLLLLLLTAPGIAQESTLQGMRGDVRNPADSGEKRARSKKKQPSETHADCDDDDDPDLNLFFGETFATAALVALTSPYWVPHQLAGDDFQIPAYFPDAPYVEVEGYLQTQPDDIFAPRKWAGQFAFDYGHNFGDLSTASGNLLLETTSRFGLDTEWRYWMEDLPNGQEDQLWTGDFNLVYRFAQNEHLAMRSGLGFNWLADSVGSEFGFNFTYGADFFPRKPWVFSAEIDWGRLGHAGLFHGRLTGGITRDGYEIYTGYDYSDIGGSQINSFIAGIRLWF